MLIISEVCPCVLLCTYIHVCKFALLSLHLYMKEGRRMRTCQWFVYQVVSQICAFHKWLTCGLVIFTDSITQLIWEHGEQFVTTSVRFKVETFVFWFLYPQWVFFFFFHNGYSDHTVSWSLHYPCCPSYILYRYLYSISLSMFTHIHIYTQTYIPHSYLYTYVSVYLYTHTYIYIIYTWVFPNIFTISYSKTSAGNIYS